MGEVVIFPRRPRSPAAKPPNPRGIVSVYPCALTGRGWVVEHINGDSRHCLGSWGTLDDALAEAGWAAVKLCADFDTGDGGGHAA